MKKIALALVLLMGMTVALNGHFNYEWNRVASAATPTPIPCQFAGYDQSGGLYNTSIVCATPSAGPGAGTPAAGTCIGVATPPAAGTISYTCATPGPQATPSPIAGSNITITGSWPYTFSASGGGGGLPFSFVQETWCAGSAGCTLTLPKTAAASGNTLLLFLACDNATVTLPSGFSSVIKVDTSTGGAVLDVATAASAAQTSLVSSCTGGNGFAAYAAELTGSRTVDVQATATPSAACPCILPGLTPGATSVAFFSAAYADAGSPHASSVITGGNGSPMENASISNNTTTNGRGLCIAISLVAASSGIPLIPPACSPVNGTFGSSPVSEASFTLK